MELEILRHSAAHILAIAVKELYPGAKLGIGPSIEDGFYYDFDNLNIKEEDLEKIEQKCLEVIKRNLKFEKLEKSKEEAKEILKDEPYKLELLEEIDNPIFYKTGDFLDLCSGPHVNYTKKIKALKLLKLAGAYWKGDSKNKMLSRIYGIAFENKIKLNEYLELKEEAEKRNHIKLGKEMGLFSFHEEAPGMPFFHDKGSFIFDKLVEYMKEEMHKLNYEINKTPLILNQDLWLRSGHWDHFKENMYFTKIDEKDFAVKPMNCPGNLLVFKDDLHSYRELPIKAGEFGIVHRHELSGTLNGLFRVRFFTQDDAHIFCTEEQIQEQIIELIELVDRVYSKFGLKYYVELSTKPGKAIGDDKLWERAEKALEEALNKKKIEFKLNQGDGAFYGPKIDFHIEDSLKRTWQCGTIQLDFQMPERFELTYEGKDGQKHQPVMLHRAIYGSVERFLGNLVEHFNGKFPLWLSPNQVKVLSITDKNLDYAKEIYNELKKENIRVELDDRNESLNKKIREAQLERYNFILTIGDKEADKKTIAVRDRLGKNEFGVKLNDFIGKLKNEINERSL
jgi:threonyl-tRNA synthetase